MVDLYYDLLKTHRVSIQDLKSYGFTIADIENIVTKQMATLKDGELIINCVKDMLYIFIVAHKYNYALELLDLLYTDTFDENNVRDYKYYYFLLSYVTTLSDKQLELVRTMSYEDMCLIDKSLPVLGPNNSVRRKAVKCRFDEAFSKLNEIIKGTKHRNINEEKATYELLLDINQKEKEKVLIMYALLFKKRYDELYDYLRGINDNRVLSRYEDAILVLLNDYYALLDGKDLETDIKGDTFIDTVKLHNYHDALKMSEYCEELISHKDYVDMIVMLLNEMVSLKKESTHNYSRVKKPQ